MLIMFDMIALRLPSDSITAPEYSSATSTTTYSTGSHLLAVAFRDDDLRLGDRELVAFATHRLDQDRKMQLAAPADFERIGAIPCRRRVGRRSIRVRASGGRESGARLDTCLLCRRTASCSPRTTSKRSVRRPRRRECPRVHCASAIVSPMLRSSIPETQTMSPAAASSRFSANTARRDARCRMSRARPRRGSWPCRNNWRIDFTDFKAHLDRLPADQREALVLIGASGFSYEEAAEICGPRRRHDQEPRQPGAAPADELAVPLLGRKFRPDPALPDAALPPSRGD